MKYLTILLAFVFLLSLVSAEQQTFGTFIQGQMINLTQTCGNCSYINISYVSNNNGYIIQEKNMTKVGPTTFTYNLDGQQVSGNYKVCGYADENGVRDTWCADFNVNPTGSEFTSSQAPILYISIGLTFIFALFFFALGIIYSSPAPRIIFFGLSGIMLIVSILYSLVMAEQLIPNQLVIIDGLATLWSVIKILVGIFVVLLLLFALYIVYWSWNKKRGFTD